MIKLFPASSRYSADHGWLKSNFSFSFADYYNPDNMSFGPLRVFNDDTVQGLRGFGAHPHREMEIVSVVLKGQLKHEDSTGHSAITSYGEVQRMSAGTGIVHSETNPEEGEVQFLQLWFTPDQHGLEPSYETSKFDTEKMHNQLLPVVSNHSGENVSHIHQNMTIYLSDLDTDKKIEFNQEIGRKIYVFVMEGSLILNEESLLSRRDAARIEDISSLKIKANVASKFMLIDLP